MHFVIDDSGDLINLAWIEMIIIQPIEEGDSKPSPEATHELIAVNPNQGSYRLRAGSEALCVAERANLARHLTR